MSKKHMHIIVEKEVLTSILDVQNSALKKYDVYFKQNTFAEIALKELLTQINEDENKLKEILLKYEVLKYDE